MVKNHSPRMRKSQHDAAQFTGYHPPKAAGEGTTMVEAIRHCWLIPVVTTLGALIGNLIVFRFAPEAEGHGTDAAIESFHFKGGQVRPRIPPIKLIASAITIGSGGSGGREGPAALAAREALGQLADGELDPSSRQALANYYDAQVRRLDALLAGDVGGHNTAEQWRGVQLQLLAAEHETVEGLVRTRQISAAVAERVQRGIDLAAERLMTEGSDIVP